MQTLDKLKELRNSGGAILTQGLSEQTIMSFLERDPKLGEAIDEAHFQMMELKQTHPDLVASDEATQVSRLQRDYTNFYAADVVNPYVPAAARGPWIVTSKGAVVHDSGGYGMLGLGHAPEPILDAMSQTHVMANVMTPSFSHLRLGQALKSEIGHQRGSCPYDKFLCLNSGSEAVTVAARFSDINAKNMTDPGGRHEGKQVKILALKGGFHGRTDRPSQFSDSTRESYVKHLRTFRDRDNLMLVEPNNVDQLNRVFEDADRANVFLEAFFMEPVMGEGNPGMAITPEFYRAARDLTKKNGTLLLVDSIQAGLRARGCLSIVDYPGFETLEAPDMETFSKALNAGQFPLSVLAATSPVAGLYRVGAYGNTMTTNPRAMDVACATIEQITPEIRSNIVERGKEFLSKLHALKTEMDGRITGVQGTGLLVSCELHPRYKVYGKGSIEEYMRRNGVGVIHGGSHSLRYTPHFRITSEELDLIVDATRNALLNS